MCTITIRTDEKLKKDAQEIFESLGMNLSVAINLFLKQAVIQNNFPLIIESGDKEDNYLKTYPKKFFDLLGSAKDIDIEIPNELEYDKEDISL